MLTSFQAKKWTHLFHLYDLDGNGVVTREDFELKVKAVAERRGVASDTPGYEAIQASVMEDWEHLRNTADQNGDGMIQLQEWLQHGAVIINDDEMYETISREAHAILVQYDKNGDGILERDEIIGISVTWGVAKDDAIAAFPKLDINGNGRLSISEYKQLLEHFHKSDDPSDPGNYLFGEGPFRL